MPIRVNTTTNAAQSGTPDRGSTSVTAPAVVLIVNVTGMPTSDAVGGLKLHDAPAGSPLQVKDAVPAVGCTIARKLKAAGCPAVTVELVAPFGTMFTALVTVLVSTTVLLVRFESPPPESVAFTVRVPGAFPSTLAVTIISG